MVKILQKENSILRQVAKEVPIEEIATPKIQKILREMKNALHAEGDGVAIAAPQIGYSLRIFIVCSAFFDTPTHKPPSQKKSGGGDTEEVEKNYIKEAIKKPHADWVFINPKVLKLSRKKEKMKEGCLSVRWFYGNMERSIQAKIQAYDEKGEIFERGSSGMLAQVFQHEIDHLNGILFIDKAENLKNIPPEDS